MNIVSSPSITIPQPISKMYEVWPISRASSITWALRRPDLITTSTPARWQASSARAGISVKPPSASRKREPAVRRVPSRSVLQTQAQSLPDGTLASHRRGRVGPPPPACPEPATGRCPMPSRQRLRRRRGVPRRPRPCHDRSPPRLRARAREGIAPREAVLAHGHVGRRRTHRSYPRRRDPADAESPLTELRL